MKLAHTAFYAILLVMLSACASLGIQPPKSFNAGLQDGYTSITAIAQTATTLKTAGKLSNDDVDNIVGVLEQMKSGLDIAQQIHATNPQAGIDRLSTVVTSLTALQAYLLSRSST